MGTTPFVVCGIHMHIFSYDNMMHFLKLAAIFFLFMSMLTIMYDGNLKFKDVLYFVFARHIIIFVCIYIYITQQKCPHNLHAPCVYGITYFPA